MTPGHFEPELYDFQEALPHKKNDADKEGLRVSCCAFANSSGGFLIFGIKDASSGAVGKERLVGLPPDSEFAAKFGNYPGGAEPSVRWTIKSPPIHLATGNVVHVVHIPRSWKAPHCLALSSVAKRFPKRTDKGTEEMSYEEIRLMFLQYYEKRLKLQL